MSKKKDIAVFLDRDGTINKDVDYLKHKEDLELIDGSSSAIKRLNQNNIKVIVVTNQSGVARGFFTEEDVREINRELERSLNQEGASLDGVFYCPHHPSSGNGQYTYKCNCRKPEIGMLKDAASEFNLDLSGSYVVGDKFSDVLLAHNVSGKGVLVLTGYGKGEKDKLDANSQKKIAYTAENLYAAVEWILESIKKR